MVALVLFVPRVKLLMAILTALVLESLATVAALVGHEESMDLGVQPDFHPRLYGGTLAFGKRNEWSPGRRTGCGFCENKALPPILAAVTGPAHIH